MTDDQIFTALGLRDAGADYATIARLMGIPQKTVARELRAAECE